MGTVRVGQAEVAYDVVGDGEAVVLVHGSTGSRATWMLQTPVLAEHYRVVLPEYAGGGETTDAGGPLEVDDLAAQVLGVVDDLGIDRFHLGGYSLGAVVAAVAAAERPASVRSLALVCGWAKTDARQRFTFDLWQRLLRADRELFARYAVADSFTSTWFEAMGDGVEAVVPMVEPGLSAGSDRHAELDARVDISDRLHAITAPTLVVGATQDRWVPIEHSRHLAATIGSATLLELDAGHSVISEQGPDVADVLLDFFRRH